MNRKARRAARKGNPALSVGAPDRAAQVGDLIEEARRAVRDGQLVPARDICRQILAVDPSHAVANNLLGTVLQSMDRDKTAIVHFEKAIAANGVRATYHYNLGCSLQKLGRADDAVPHFTRALALGMDGQPIAELIAREPFVAAALDRLAQQWPRRQTLEALFTEASLADIAGDIFLRCALTAAEIGSLELENFFGAVRFGLLQRVAAGTLESSTADAQALAFCAALAQQCFITEYVYAQSDEEAQQAEVLRDRLVARMAAGEPVPPLLLVTVAAYLPLHALPGAAALADREWPPALQGLLRQQISEPLAERALRASIPALTAIDDGVSRAVRQQYEENPYPRWIAMPDASVTDRWRSWHDGLDENGAPVRPREILIAGCGTGQHPILTARHFPEARILAVDLSAASLAYALRKSRELGVANIDYAQADILKLGILQRSFDRIEAIGVLHHLADPKAGWLVLLSLLRPGGVMDIGLYSETARRAIVAARALIAERGYRATAEDIRRLQHELAQTDAAPLRDLFVTSDLYSVSGCRDLLFHVMEHRFTIPDIAAFLSENGLSFLGFTLDAKVLEQFARQFPGLDAPTDLDCWHAFEQANPRTFQSMYKFSVRKDR